MENHSLKLSTNILHGGLQLAKRISNLGAGVVGSCMEKQDHDALNGSLAFSILQPSFQKEARQINIQDHTPHCGQGIFDKASQSMYQTLFRSPGLAVVDRGQKTGRRRSRTESVRDSVLVCSANVCKTCFFKWQRYAAFQPWLSVAETV